MQCSSDWPLLYNIEIHCIASTFDFWYIMKLNCCLTWVFLFQGIGRQSTVSELAKSLGKPLYTFNCSKVTDSFVLHDIFKGFAATGEISSKLLELGHHILFWTCIITNQFQGQFLIRIFLSCVSRIVNNPCRSVSNKDIFAMSNMELWR